MFHPKGPTFFQLARQALSSTKRGYDLLAPQFDYTPFRTADWVFAAFTEQLSLGNPKPEFNDVLDVCCGTGAAMQALEPFCCGRLVGIDMSQKMLDQAAQNLSKVNHPHKEFVLGDAFEMSFANEFDLAVSFGAFGHIVPNDESFFIERIFQALKPGGRFAFVTHEMPGVFSMQYWMARGFNGAMRIRNLLIRPPFIMYYLTFLWPEIRLKLESAGFEVADRALFPNETNLKAVRFVTAQKPFPSS